MGVSRAKRGKARKRWNYALYEADWMGRRRRENGGGSSLEEIMKLGTSGPKTCTSPASWRPRSLLPRGGLPQQRQWAREWGRLPGCQQEETLIWGL